MHLEKQLEGAVVETRRGGVRGHGGTRRNKKAEFGKMLNWVMQREIETRKENAGLSAESSASPTGELNSNVFYKRRADTKV